MAASNEYRRWGHEQKWEINFDTSRKNATSRPSLAATDAFMSSTARFPAVMSTPLAAYPPLVRASARQPMSRRTWRPVKVMASTAHNPTNAFARPLARKKLGL